MALDVLLASQGRVCTVINTSCCVYIDQRGRISTDLNEIWKQTRLLHEVQKDDTSFGFAETWKWLTSGCCEDVANLAGKLKVHVPLAELSSL